MKVLCSSIQKTLIFSTIFIPFLFSEPLSCAQGLESKSAVEEHLNGLFKEKTINDLRPLLSANSKIFLSLEKIKDAKGFFSPDQTILIFKEFLERITPLDFSLVSSIGEAPDPLFIKVRLTFKDSQSKISTINAAFIFIRESGFWKIKEIKESSS